MLELKRRKNLPRSLSWLTVPHWNKRYNRFCCCCSFFHLSLYPVKNVDIARFAFKSSSSLKHSDVVFLVVHNNIFVSL